MSALKTIEVEVEVEGAKYLALLARNDSVWQLDAMKPTQPAPDARFVLRIAGVVLRCKECGNDRFIKLSPTDDGKLRFGCTGCDASYLVEGAGSPRLLED